MDSSKKYLKKSPEENANFISKLFFCWFLPFFNFGYKNDVKLSDIYNAAKSDLSGPMGDKLEKMWLKEIEDCKNTGSKPKLKKILLKMFFTAYISSGVCLGINFLVIKLLQPIVLAEYINFFTAYRYSNDNTYGWIYASTLVGITCVYTVLSHKSSMETQRVGMRVRIAVCSLIYRKLLKLSHSSLGVTAAGQLVNFLSNDVQRFDLVAQYLHYIWIMPISCVAFIYILYRNVGIWATIVAMGFVSMQSVPLQGFFSQLKGKFRVKIAQRTDSRVKLMNEITTGIQVIKMYAWEKPFEKIVELYRKLEIDLITKTSYLNGVLSSMCVFTERLTLYLTVITFVLLGNGNVSGDVAFSLAQLFNTIQAVMIYFFPQALNTYAEAVVSIDRIQNFLLLEEIDTKQINSEHISTSDVKGEIDIRNVSASYTDNPIVPTLIDLNLHLKPGTLCCVVGHVGSGKSSILQLFLKELCISDGQMSIGGKISYACQEPWLFVSNVRDNILFGKPYVKTRYNEVVRVCSLQRDFQQFPFGDKTLVGERGTSLSGGQRARVNLARAVYSEADIYLLDDPLSAVDTKVGRHLFDKCILNYLKGKTRILVTHQLQFMKKADLIVVLNNGKIEKVGTFDDLSEKELSSLQQETHKKKKQQEKVDGNLVLEEKIIVSNQIDSIFMQSNTTLASIDYEPGDTDELIEKGSISNSLYWEYYSSGNSIAFILFTTFMIFLGQFVANLSDLWLSNWTNLEAQKAAALTDIPSDFTISLEDVHSNITSTTPIALILDNITDIVSTSTSAGYFPNQSTAFYISIYSVLIFGSAFLLTWRSFLYYQVCMKSSKTLHHKMFHNILEAPMRFFDTNPSGRILNRFSKDMGAIDELLPRCQLDAIQIFMVLFGILTMVFIMSPWMIIPTGTLVPLFFYGRLVYLKTAQAIKRLEGTSRAPVFSYLTASLYGISTIRSSQVEKMVENEFDILQDQHTSTWFLFIVSSEAFGLILDLISILYLALVTFQFLIFRNENTMSGNVGLAISHTMILTGMLQYGIRQSAEVASNMISVERVLQYTKLDKEGPFESLPTKKPPRDWPEKGRIVFKNTYLRYALELPPVLKNLNIVVESGEKIGIVGRTGAGKSTLIASLFRLAPIDGTIAIDGVDTGEIGLNDLRLNISIIPQEPVLFSASVRYNLDPFEKHSDEVLWKALENVELKNSIKDLNQVVTEGGSNFSAGQRQLICLARAIVRNNKVLVMDEATANVDPQTDALIQRTIRERFRDCTVLTIAHRLNTIMDSDKVLVMDAGQAMEYDHPYILLQNQDGYFSKMVNETGPVMEEQLMDVARDSYRSKHAGDNDNSIIADNKND